MPAIFTFTAADSGNPAPAPLSTAAQSDITVERVLAAFRYLVPSYKEVQAGVDQDGKPIMHTLTDAETFAAIGARYLQEMLQAVLSAEARQAAEAPQGPLFKPVSG